MTVTRTGPDPGPATSGTPGATRTRRPRGRVRATQTGQPLGVGSTLGLGIAMTWFSLLVLIPLAAVLVAASTGGWDGFWTTITSTQTASALRLTVVEAWLEFCCRVGFGDAAARSGPREVTAGGV